MIKTKEELKNRVKSSTVDSTHKVMKISNELRHFSESEFLSWFEEDKSKKRGTKPKLTHAEKWDLRRSQVEKEYNEVMTLEDGEKTLAYRENGKYKVCERLTPEQALNLCEWIKKMESTK